MKLLMISNVDILNKNSAGILNKLLGQAKAFKNYKIDVDLIYNNLHIVVVDKLDKNEKIMIRPSNTENYYSRILELIYSNQYNVIYIRYPLSDYYFLSFLKNIKRINKNIKLILDFPTYPYKMEIYDENILTIDAFFSKYLRNYVDFGICYNKLKYIYDIPVYYIGNGIDLESISIKKKSVKSINRINMIAVANVAFWQGYDRIIEGLKIYYSENNYDHLVYFSIVGGGSDIAKLENLVNHYNLQQYIIFNDYKLGAELDELFDNYDIGVGTLGMYRKGMEDGSTLKAREYCARGIPFVLGYEDLDFPSNFKYVHKVTNDNAPININDIVNFYHKIHDDKELVPNMRKYAEGNLTWEAKLKPIIKELMK